MKKQPIHNNYEIVKGTLKHDVFPELRKHGLIARLNFECCSSCASYALHEDMNRINIQENKKKKVVGSVFYNRQDEDHLKRTGIVYLKYIAVDEDTNENAREIGTLIKTISEKFKLKADWDGSPYKAIMVSAPDEN
jgi:hypothetical protein